jgi:hypothetical protein
MTQMQAEAVPVNSTLLARMSYQAGAALLHLEFRDGALYCYWGVPREIYEGLLTANSKALTLTARFEAASSMRS